MIKKIFADYLVPIALLTGFAITWPVSQWGITTALSLLLAYTGIAITGVALSKHWRTRLEEKQNLSQQTILQSEQRIRDLAQAYTDVENELKSLRVEFSNTDKVKDRFLANISHEIRTPMNGIFGMTELLGHTKLNSKQKQYADTIRRSTESLLNIVNDILDFSRIQNGELKLECTGFRLSELVEDVCDIYASAAQNRGIEVICDVSKVAGQNVNGDPTRVRQVLNNLVSNSLKFTEQGEILVSVSPTSTADQFEFCVADTGIGIATEVQEDIFKEFIQGDTSTTRKFGGTGLGLSISNKLVTLMQGELKLQSEVGIGSTFTFTCNLTYIESAESDTTKYSKLKGLKVLVVDDNDTNSSILVHQLEQWDIDATSVDCGRAGLDTLQQALVESKPFDIAILDLHMPHMDGLELASQIQCNVNYASLKTMMLTSSLTNMSADELKGIGVLCTLTKPARQASLYHAIASMIEDIPDLPALTREAASVVNKPKILLTEDNPINQEVAYVMLESIGCDVEIAENGSEAVDALAAQHFDLVFMDCQMPVMDGFEATRTIRNESQQHDIPVVALTANAMDGDRELCLASGMDDYLSKPVNQSELQSTIEKWLHQKSIPAENTGTTHPILTEAVNSMNFEFDESALDAIKALQRPGKPDILARIVNMYLEKTPELIADIEGGVAANDAARVRMAAHTLKSSSAYLGAKTLADQCNKLESKASNEDLTDVESDLVVISKGFDAISEQITRFA